MQQDNFRTLIVLMTFITLESNQMSTQLAYHFCYVQNLNC